MDMTNDNGQDMGTPEETMPMPPAEPTTPEEPSTEEGAEPTPGM